MKRKILAGLAAAVLCVSAAHATLWTTNFTGINAAIPDANVSGYASTRSVNNLFNVLPVNNTTEITDVRVTLAGEQLEHELSSSERFGDLLGRSQVMRKLFADLEAIAADELLLLATFMRRPAPELQVVALERDAILAATNGVALAA